MTLIIRPAVPNDVAQIAGLWFDGWHDGHAAICPAELTALRTLNSFTDRAGDHLGRAVVAEKDGAVIGFYMLKDDEVYQFYVGSAGRGTGVAKAIMDHAEAQFVSHGRSNVWLACSIGNDRAARFYEKCGWARAGIVIEDVEVSTGLFPLEVWRYEKAL